MPSQAFVRSWMCCGIVLAESHEARRRQLQRLHKAIENPLYTDGLKVDFQLGVPDRHNNARTKRGMHDALVGCEWRFG